MDPYERWDDWEWERAAKEVGRERGIRPDNWPRKSTYKSKRHKFGPLYTWTGMQKKATLSVLLFLMIFFASKGQDVISKGVYAVYRGSVESGDVYASLNGMAMQVIGMSGMEVESTPVNASMKGKFLPPVSGRVMAGFGETDSKGEASLHNGIDVGSALGIPVVSPYSGVVTLIGEDPQLGRIIKLDFGEGWTGVLGNLGDVSVQNGQKIEAGQVLGTVGLSAPLKKTWLHFELRKDGKPVDPLPYIIPSN